MIVTFKYSLILNVVMVLTASFSSIGAFAITTPDHSIEFKQCPLRMKLPELSKYQASHPWYTIKQAKEKQVIFDTRIIEVNDFHKAIGQKAPIPESVFESEPTSTVTFDLKSPRGLVWQAKDLSWRSQMGTKVTIALKKNNKLTQIDQVVTGSEYLRDIELDAVQQVVSAQLIQDGLPAFSQAGIIMLFSKDLVMSSEVFGVNDDEEFNFRIAKNEMEKLNERIRTAGHTQILKIVYARSLIGRGVPLGVDDAKFLKTLVRMNRGVQVEIIGVPSEDHGYVAFEMRSP